MPKWRVLIADDEPAARRGLRQLLAAHADFEIVGECRNGREVLSALDDVGADVLFLDIRMPELSGFDVIRQRTPERMPLVVFLTAYDQFALPAFEAEAIDYLVKPVSDARFASTIKRVTKRLKEGIAGGREPSLVVSTARGVLVFPLSGIDWIEAADYYARVWVGKRSYLLRESLRAIERRFGAGQFVRAHRHALVRIASVRALHASPDGGLVAVLASGIRVPVSRRRRSAFASAVKALALL
jgi:two-component system, LytTR family, response regulator